MMITIDYMYIHVVDSDDGSVSEDDLVVSGNIRIFAICMSFYLRL
jgi:hypothetical protein